MDEADQTQRYSNSGGSGGGPSGSGSGSGSGGFDIGGVSRSPKMPKQKKVPQRGLGVAQLEKIRLEEQQKRDPVAVTAALILSTPPTVSKKSSSILSLPLPSPHTSYPSSSFPLSSPSLGDLSSLNMMIRPLQPVQNVGLRNSSTSLIKNLVNDGGSEAGCSGISVSGHGSVPKLLNSKVCNLQENPVVDPASALLSNLNLPYESDDSVWSSSHLMPRIQQHQQPSHAMVNVSSGTSSSSVLNSRMEPPSNQSLYGNYAHIWPEEEKVVGVKRPYPFSPENLPRSSFNYSIYASVAPIRSDETVSCGNEGTLKFEVCNAPLRERPSCSSSDTKLNLNLGIKEKNEVLHGDFLTLAPPSNPSMRPSSTSKHYSVYLDPCNHIPDFESLPYQGSAEGPIIQPGQSQFSGQPFYSFFPPVEQPVGEATTSTREDRNVSRETGDLNLKL